MDRRSRRFVPSSEGLEGRQLLASAAASAVNTISAITNPALSTSSGTQVDEGPAAQQTIEAKRHRIENLPFFIGMLNKDGFVPQPATENIQNDLDNLVAELKQANSSLVSSFNLDLRKAQSYENITPISAASLNRDFGAVLVSAGAPASTVANLQEQLTQLIDYDSTQVGSTTAATNDEALVLQLAQIIGRPLVYPAVPTLLGSDHVGNDGKIPVTHDHQPSLTGSYAVGVEIQIVNFNNNTVLGEAPVGANGTYTVKFNEPLPDGTYTVRTRVVDSGFVSDPSPKFTFKVVTPPPPKT
jgi:Bacterial Ig-like domain